MMIETTPLQVAITGIKESYEKELEKDAKKIIHEFSGNKNDYPDLYFLYDLIRKSVSVIEPYTRKSLLIASLHFLRTCSKTEFLNIFLKKGFEAFNKKVEEHFNSIREKKVLQQYADLFEKVDITLMSHVLLRFMKTIPA